MTASDVKELGSNVYYVPPMLLASFNADGRFSDEPRVPTEYLRYLLGPGGDQALITSSTAAPTTQVTEMSS